MIGAGDVAIAEVEDSFFESLGGLRAMLVCRPVLRACQMMRGVRRFFESEHAATKDRIRSR